ncbi:hypothetical protein HMPREF3150_01744 [Pseudomonas aeruginosa]|nr:hypothetical protein HMPREF3150_01744 [Pseudomonas aeruginosa]
MDGDDGASGGRGAAMRGGPRRRPGAQGMSDRPKARPTPL